MTRVSVGPVLSQAPFLTDGPCRSDARAPKGSSLPPTLLLLPPPSLVAQSLHRAEKRKPEFPWVPGGLGLGPSVLCAPTRMAPSLLQLKAVGAAEWDTGDSH